MSCCLSVAQALLLINNVVFITLNGLAGHMLATDKSLATLPVTGYVVGGALWAIPASHIMRRFGRRSGFIFGTLMGIAGSALCALAVYAQSFVLLCVATLVAGAYTAFAIQYRFAAVDVSPPELRAKAIAFVLAGGVAGGILGPESAKFTKDLLPIPFVGSYLSLMIAGLISMAISSFASGVLLHANGWTILNLISLAPLAVLCAALIWLAWVRRIRATPAVAA